jgi:hypothetical protein
MVEPSRYRAWLVVVSVALLFVQLGLLALEIPVALEGRTDFRAFYAAGYLIRTGHRHEIYNYERTIEAEKVVAGTKGPDIPFVHPAYEGLFFAGLARFSYRKAFWIYTTISVVLLAIVLWWLGRPTGKSGGEAYALLIGAAFLPTGICLIEGQNSILVLAVVAAAYALQKAEKEFAAGLVLGAAAFRFPLLLPIVLLLLLARRWKFVAGFLVTSGSMAAISVWVAGTESLMGYPRYLAAMSVGLQTDAQKLALTTWPTAMPNIRGFLSAVQIERLGPWLAQTLTAAVSLGLLAWTIWKRLPFELMPVVAVLVSYHGNIHDSVLLLLPMLALSFRPQGTPQVASWFAVLILPTVFFVSRIPFAFLAPIYLWFLTAAKGRCVKALQAEANS